MIYFIAWWKKMICSSFKLYLENKLRVGIKHEMCWCQEHFYGKVCPSGMQSVKVMEDLSTTMENPLRLYLYPSRSQKRSLKIMRTVGSNLYTYWVGHFGLCFGFLVSLKFSDSAFRFLTFLYWGLSLGFAHLCVDWGLYNNHKIRIAC